MTILRYDPDRDPQRTIDFMFEAGYACVLVEGQYVEFVKGKRRFRSEGVLTGLAAVEAAQMALAWEEKWGT